MAFNVNDFRGKLQNGGARASMFEVILPPPANISALNTEELSFMCKATALPASTVGTIEVPYFGRKIKLPGDRTFDQWTITVINDESFDLRDAFERWQSAIASFNTVSGAQRGLGSTSNPFSYVSTGIINQYGKEGDIIKSVALVNCFPINVGEIQLSWEDNDTIEEFEVTFEYDYFTSPSAL